MALFTTFFTRVCTKPHIAFLDKCRWSAGPIAWPPRSSDVTPTDFSLWGFQNSSIARFLAAGLSNRNGRLWQKLWTLKKSLMFITFHLIRLINLKFDEGRDFHFSFKMFILQPILLHFGLCCPGHPRQSPYPSYAHIHRECGLLPSNAHGPPWGPATLYES
jgi:hypothetical protein